MFHSELRYPSMAGFPIISLSSLTGTYYDDCHIIMPEFEVEEFYSNKSELAIKSWQNRYLYAYQTNLIKSIDVLPNNLQSTNGITTNYDTSFGFTSSHNNEYKNDEKYQNITNFRVDSFYVQNINRHFFEENRENYRSNITNIHMNLPNATSLSNWVNLSSFYIDNLYINVPKLVGIGMYFLQVDKKMKNMYINVINTVTMGSDAFEDWTNSPVNIYTTLGFDKSNELKSIFDIQKNDVGVGNGSNAVFVAKSETISIEDFDLRYLDLWQNESGSDC